MMMISEIEYNDHAEMKLTAFETTSYSNHPLTARTFVITSSTRLQKKAQQGNLGEIKKDKKAAKGCGSQSKGNKQLGQY